VSDKSTLATIAFEFGGLLAPLRRAATDPGALQTLLRRLGLRTGTSGPDLTAVSSAVANVMQLAQDLADDPSLKDVETAFAAVAAVHTALKSVTPPAGITAEELARSLFELLLLDYLSARFPKLYFFFKALGIIKTEAVKAAGDRLPFAKTTIDWEALPARLQDPLRIAEAVFNWGTDTFAFDALAEPLFDFLLSLGLRAELQTLHDPVEQYAYVANPEAADRGAARQLKVILMDSVESDVPVEVGVVMRELPADGEGPAGVIFEPVISKQVAATLDLTDTVSLKTTISDVIPDRFGIQIRPKLDSALRLPFGEAAAGLSGEASVALQITPEEKLFLFGRPGATRLEATGAELVVKATLSTSTAPELVLRAGLIDAAVVVSTQDLDGFLGSVGPSETRANLDFGLQWSTRTGLGFSGSSAFGVNLALHESIGPVLVSALRLAVRGEGASPATLVVAAAVDFSVAIGPIAASVQDLGLRLKIKNSDGNLGPFDLGLGLGVPTGVGIAINGGPVSGGGFLSFEDGKYTGALALQVYSVAVKAFGIIETKFPDGRPGFSFIVIISAEFTPIQLGFGFTLLGVGGILGINRDLDEDALRSALERGALGNVLFPKDPVRDAPSILHDVESLFPPVDGRYVFGPMAKLGWGTPAIVDARLGIVIVFPGPRIALLGTVAVIFPPGAAKPEQRLVEIHMDIDGVLDFPKKHFQLQARLHDSQIRGFPISGDMAMLLDWGQNPNFVIALGGFHPHYTPPAGFPKLRRLAIDLGIKGNPSATLSSYLAVTSNTAQVGAALDVSARKSGASLSGGLAFDALIVFSPFSFEASLEGGVHVDFHGAGFGMHFHGKISGPAPWHLEGDVCVSILWWDACVGFSITLGGESKPVLPELDVWNGSAPDAAQHQDVPGLNRALSAPGNWSGVLPPNGYQAVSLRDTDSSTAARVDPLGVAAFQQKVLPFDLALSRFAGRDRAKNNVVTVSVNKVVVDNDDLKARGRVNAVSDFFAPAQYQKLPDAQALSSPSFQKMQAGFSLSSNDLKTGTEQLQDITFTTFVVGAPGPGSNFSVTSDDVLLAMVGRSATASAGMRTGNIDRFVDFAKDPSFSLPDETYFLASKITLRPYAPLPDPGPYALKADQLAGLPKDVRAGLQIVPFHELAAA
jgi:hypothetical protein